MPTLMVSPGTQRCCAGFLKRFTFHSGEGSTPTNSHRNRYRGRVRRQHAHELALDIDSGAASEAELTDEARDIVDAEVVGEHVVVGIAGHDDRLVHVHHAVAARGGVAEPIVAEYEIARIEDRLRRGPCAELERGKRHVGLEGRPRRVESGERAVVERRVRGVVERVPVCRVDAVDEEVRVVAGPGYEGEYAAGGRLDRDERPAVFAEGALSGFL